MERRERVTWEEGKERKTEAERKREKKNTKQA